MAYNKHNSQQMTMLLTIRTNIVVSHITPDFKNLSWHLNVWTKYYQIPAPSHISIFLDIKMAKENFVFPILR